MNLYAKFSISETVFYLMDKSSLVFIVLDARVSGEGIFTDYHFGGQYRFKYRSEFGQHVYEPYSMLSMGACAVTYDRRWLKQSGFYAEIKPIGLAYDGSFRDAVSGLKCLRKLSDPRYNPNADLFDPKKVMEYLINNMSEPFRAMVAFETWVKENIVEGQKPVLVGVTRNTTSMFDLYQAFFGSGEQFFYQHPNIFGTGVLDIASVYKGFRKDITAETADLSTRTSANPKLDSLETALQNAELLIEILNLMKGKYETQTGMEWEI